MIMGRHGVGVDWQKFMLIYCIELNLVTFSYKNVYVYCPNVWVKRYTSIMFCYSYNRRSNCKLKINPLFILLRRICTAAFVMQGLRLLCKNSNCKMRLNRTGSSPCIVSKKTVYSLPLQFTILLHSWFTHKFFPFPENVENLPSSLGRRLLILGRRCRPGPRWEPPAVLVVGLSHPVRLSHPAADADAGPVHTCRPGGRGPRPWYAPKGTMSRDEELIK